MWERTLFYTPPLLGLTLPLPPHHPFLCSLPATGSGLQVDIHCPGITECGQDSLFGRPAILEFCLGMGLAIEPAPWSVLV